MLTLTKESLFLSILLSIIILQVDTSAEIEMPQPQKNEYTLVEGGSAFIKCPNNPDDNYNQFDECTITHEKKCNFEQKYENGNLTDAKVHCTTSDHYDFKFDSTKCEIHLKYIEMADAGKWTCQWKINHANHGHGKTLFGEIRLHIYPRPTSSHIAYPSKTDSPIIQKNGYEITNTKLESLTTLSVGHNVTLTCDVNGYYQYCTFYHVNKTCSLGLKYSTSNKNFYIDIEYCRDFSDRIIATNDRKKCAITLKSVALEDEGEWICDIMSLNEYPLYSTSGSKAQLIGKFFLKIIPNSRIDFPIHYMKIDNEEIQNKSDEHTAKLEGMSISTLAIVVVIIGTVVISGIVGIFIFYRRKSSIKLNVLGQGSGSTVENDYVFSEMMREEEEIYEEILCENLGGNSRCVMNDMQPMCMSQSK